MYFDSKSYAARIKMLRSEQHLTQEQLAEKLNISCNYLAKIETGKRTGPIDLALSLAEIFGVTLDYLVLGKRTSTLNRKQRLQAVIAFLSELMDFI